MGIHDHGSSVTAMRLGLFDIICFPMALKAAIDLKVFEIIADAGPNAHLTPSEMVVKMPSSNPHAANSLERILRVLVAHSILTMSLRPDGAGTRIPQCAYGLTADQAHLLVPREDGLSAVPRVQFNLDKATVDCFYYLKDAVLEGGRNAFEMAHDMDFFGFGSQDPNYNRVFHDTMSNGSALVLKEIFKVYKGFSGVKQLMDVGGGTGRVISAIVSRFPHVRGVNFDLPHVIAKAPHYPGVEHVGGNMFESIPSAETIFFKHVLHDWDDERCVQLLKKCWKALPDSGGKVINVELVVPSVLGTDPISRHTANGDLWMMVLSSGGKERTVAEFDNLAKAAGFVDTIDFPISLGFHVIEFHKGVSSINN